MVILKSCQEITVCKVLWHNLLTILLKIGAKGIEVTLDRMCAKLDTRPLKIHKDKKHIIMQKGAVTLVIDSAAADRKITLVKWYSQ